MAETIGNIGTARAHAFTPRFVSQALRKMHIRATRADAAVRYAGKVRLTADARSKPTVECVIPDIQLGNERSICRGNEIHRIMRHIYNVLVGADSVEGRHFVVRQIGTPNLQANSGVRESGDSALRFRPFQNREVPGRPVLNLPRFGIVLVAEAQKNEMSAMA